MWTAEPGTGSGDGLERSRVRITLRGLNVHDVTAETWTRRTRDWLSCRPTSTRKNSTSGRFDGVLIEDVTAHDTTMWSGIIVGSAELGGEYEWVREDRSKRSTNVVVRNSTVYNTYGDGIILFVVDGGVIEHSVAHHTGIQPGPVTVGTPKRHLDLGVRRLHHSVQRSV